MNGNEEPWFDAIPGERIRIRIRGRDVAGGYSVLESISQPMTGAPLHTHREDEIFHVLEGVLTFVVDGRCIDAGPGSVVVVRAGAVHAWRNFGDVPARCLVMFTPGGIDELFAALGTVRPDELPEFAARYGSIIRGPTIER